LFTVYFTLGAIEVFVYAVYAVGVCVMLLHLFDMVEGTVVHHRASQLAPRDANSERQWRDRVFQARRTVTAMAVAATVWPGFGIVLLLVMAYLPLAQRNGSLFVSLVYIVGSALLMLGTALLVALELRSRRAGHARASLASPLRGGA